MSLEDKIEKLTKAIEALTAKVEGAVMDAAITSITLNHAQEDAGDVVDRVIPSPKPTKAKKTAEPDAEQNDVPSTADLRDKVMGIVRKDRTKKGPIKDLIASYGGAKVIDDIPQVELASFSAKLEAL